MKIKVISLLIVLLYSTLSAGVVCSEDELVQALLGDISDNSVLDCKRFKEPGDEEKNISSYWTNDCSFEAEPWGGDGKASWVAEANELFGGFSLRDAQGSTVKKDSPDEADICELIRSLYINNHFPDLNNEPDNVLADLVEQIEGVGDWDGSKILAVTGGSFAEKDKW
jgi:hypothetical protein